MMRKDTRGAFRRFWYLKENGQIFPLLVVILILVLVAVMAFINTSQVNLRKISTVNSADSAAMAGAAQMASAANTIADVNVNTLMQNYYNDLMYASVLLDTYYFVFARFSWFVSRATQNLLTYFQLLLIGFKATQQAGGTAVSMAFSNMPIEEASQRNVAMTGELLQPNVSKWLEQQNVYSRDTEFELSYNWTQYSFNITQGAQQPQSQKEMVKVNVKKPGENCFTLYPMPLSPEGTFFFFYIPPCVAVDECAACESAIANVLLAREEMVLDMVGTRIALYAIYTGAVILGLLNQGYVPALANILSIVSTAIWNTVWCFYAPLSCATVGFDFCLFLMPVPYIAYMGNNDAEISVEVTRFSPTKDLGLYRFKQQKITSGARAGLVGGNILQPHRYQSNVHEVWDGERL